LSLGPLQAMKAVISRIWVILLVPNNWDSVVSLWAAFSVALTIGGLLAILIGPRAISQRLRLTRLGLTSATGCAVLPAIHLALVGQSALGSRILYLPSITFALLIGSLVHSSSSRFAIAAAGVMILGSAGVLEHNLEVWHKVAVNAQRVCVTAARDRDAAQYTPPPPATQDGVFFFKNGFPECVNLVRSGNIR
jgi:hypothetical protein